MPIIGAGVLAEVDFKYISDTVINISGNDKNIPIFIYGYLK